MVSKTTKYEQKRAERFIRRNNERRERLNRLSNQDPVYDICESLAHAFITLIDKFIPIDEDTIRAYLNKHKNGVEEE